MKNKNLEKLFENSEKSFIVATKNGVGVVGGGVNTLTQYAELTEILRKMFSDNILKSTFELAFKDKKEPSEKEEKIAKKIETLWEELKDLLEEI